MGKVVRLTLLFAEPFWESRRFDRRSGGRSLARLSFLHTADHDVPVCWTCAPVRSRTLVAWSGGSKAAALAALGLGGIESRVIAAIARQFGMQRRRVEGLVEHCWYHDWTNDPFTLGAYSYAARGRQHGRGASRAAGRRHAVLRRRGGRRRRPHWHRARCDRNRIPCSRRRVAPNDSVASVFTRVNGMPFEPHIEPRFRDRADAGRVLGR